MKSLSWKLLAPVVILSALAPSGTAAVAAEPERRWTANVNLLVGERWLEHNDWKPVDDQFALGVEIDFRPVSWPVNLAVDLLHSFDWDWGERDDESPFFLANLFPEVEDEGYTSETDLGIRKYWENAGRVRPFVGGGVAIIRSSVKFDVPPVSDSDSGVGFWANWGLDIRFGTSGYFGIEARYSRAEVTILGDDKNAGGVHVGARLGFRW